MKTFILLFFSLAGIALSTKAQTAEELIQKVRAKLDKVNDYQANGKMKTNVAFIKAPIATIKVYYKKPNRLRIVNSSGISLVPKGSVNISLGSIFSDTQGFDIVDAGRDNTGLRIIKLLPKDDTADVVLSTLYIDEANAVIRKSKTTTRENGTYELEMNYKKFIDLGLPDKIVFSFNTKDYKLPKGVTFDYDTGSDKDKADKKSGSRKGTVEIAYSAYIINKGVDEKIFAPSKYE